MYLTRRGRLGPPCLAKLAVGLKLGILRGALTTDPPCYRSCCRRSCHCAVGRVACSTTRGRNIVEQGAALARPWRRVRRCSGAALLRSLSWWLLRPRTLVVVRQREVDGGRQRRRVDGCRSLRLPARRARCECCGHAAHPRYASSRRPSGKFRLHRGRSPCRPLAARTLSTLA